MADRDYEEPNLDAEDPESTPQNRWRWAFPVVVLLILPVAGIYYLPETTGRAPWPSHNSWLKGNVPERGQVVGTSGRAEAPVAVDQEPGIAHVDEIAANPRQFIGRQVDLQIPVAEHANDEAFWIGDGDRRVLVVFARDHRDSAQHQQSRVVANSIAPLEVGKTASIIGSIQKLPSAEQMASWELTRFDTREARSMGVYLRADRVE